MIQNFLNMFLVFKVGFLILDIFYIFFLFILLNRIFSMERLFREKHDVVILRSIAVFKILLAVSLFLLALAIL